MYSRGFFGALEAAGLRTAVVPAEGNRPSGALSAPVRGVLQAGGGAVAANLGALFSISASACVASPQPGQERKQGGSSRREETVGFAACCFGFCGRLLLVWPGASPSAAQLGGHPLAHLPSLLPMLVQGSGGAAKKTNVTIDSVFLGSEYNNAQLVSVFVFN